VCMSFYDWYCDLPPSSPQTWGEQTDVPESADWYNAGFLILWGSNVPQTRTPDAHFYTEVRYKGTKSVVICPDYSEASKFADLWLSPKQGTDAAIAMAMGHVILKEFHVDRQVSYFDDYARRYTDMPMLVRHRCRDGSCAPQTSKLPSARSTIPNGRRSRLTRPPASSSCPTARSASAGARRASGPKESSGQRTKLRLSLAPIKDDIAAVAFPYFGNREHDHFAGTDHPSVLERNVPVKRVQLKDGEALVASVYDLFLANYGIDRGFGGRHTAKSYDDNEPYTPAWAERITGVRRDQIVQVAREFARNAEKTNGRSMVIIGAGMNHWYHSDMSYRGVINMLVMCGCVGQSGGGWSHYVGQEKLRPQSGWLPLAFALDWSRPPRQQNSTSAFYAHTD
jgi:nitrate reductase / nitrite oxidoreductase, alpha subunit